MRNFQPSGEQQLGLGLQGRQGPLGGCTLRNGLPRRPTQEGLDGGGPRKPGQQQPCGRLGKSRRTRQVSLMGHPHTEEGLKHKPVKNKQEVNRKYCCFHNLFYANCAPTFTSAPGFQFTRYHGTDKKCKIISLFQGYLLSVFFKTILQFNHSPVLLRTTFFLCFFLGKETGL